MSSNVYSGLSSLKRADSRRRVAKPDALEYDLDEYGDEPDLSGSANKESNLPKPTMEGGISPESYDVRANKVIDPEKELRSDALQAIGRKIGDYAKSNQQQAAEVDQEAPLQGDLPPSDRAGVAEAPYESKKELYGPVLNNGDQFSSQQGNEGMFSRLGSGIKNYFKSQAPNREEIEKNLLNMESQTPNREEIAKNLLNMQRQAPEINLGAQKYAERNAPQLLEDEKARVLKESQEGAKQPWEKSVYGASDLIAQTPELKTKVEQITGDEWNDQVAQKVKKYETAMQEIDTNLSNISTAGDEQIKAIRENIDKNKATDQDKYYIGLALLLPLVIGGAFGAEAGLASLGGAAQGLGDIYDKRQKEIQQGEEQIADLSKQRASTEIERGNLQIKSSEIPKQIAASLPKGKLDRFSGRNSVSWVDPETGEEKEGIRFKPGIVALPEFIATDKQVEKMEKKAETLATAKTAVQSVNNLTSEIIDAASQLEDPNILGQALRAHLEGNKGLASKFSGDIINKDGRKQNAQLFFEHKLAQLTDSYRRTKELRALTATVQNHLDNLFRNPESSFQTYQDTINQMLNVRDLAQSDLVNQVENNGFSKEVFMSDFGIENRDLYSKLNKKENVKEADDILNNQIPEY